MVKSLPCEGRGAAAGGGIVDGRGERMAAWFITAYNSRLRAVTRPMPRTCIGRWHRPDDLDEILACREDGR